MWLAQYRLYVHFNILWCVTHQARQNLVANSSDWQSIEIVFEHATCSMLSTWNFQAFGGQETCQFVHILKPDSQTSQFLILSYYHQSKLSSCDASTTFKTWDHILLICIFYWQIFLLFHLYSSWFTFCTLAFYFLSRKWTRSGTELINL